MTGVVGPIATYLYGTTAQTSRSPGQLFVEAGVLIASSVCVHVMASLVLRRLDR